MSGTQLGGGALPVSSSYSEACTWAAGASSNPALAIPGPGGKGGNGASSQTGSPRSCPQGDARRGGAGREPPPGRRDACESPETPRAFPSSCCWGSSSRQPKSLRTLPRGPFCGVVFTVVLTETSISVQIVCVCLCVSIYEHIYMYFKNAYIHVRQEKNHPEIMGKFKVNLNLKWNLLRKCNASLVAAVIFSTNQLAQGAKFWGWWAEGPREAQPTESRGAEEEPRPFLRRGTRVCRPRAGGGRGRLCPGAASAPGTGWGQAVRLRAGRCRWEPGSRGLLSPLSPLCHFLLCPWEREELPNEGASAYGVEMLGTEKLQIQGRCPVSSKRAGGRGLVTS